eukprot:4931118-Pyramimonas_sp.AAC.3
MPRCSRSSRIKISLPNLPNIRYYLATSSTPFRFEIAQIRDCPDSQPPEPYMYMYTDPSAQPHSTAGAIPAGEG